MSGGTCSYHEQVVVNFNGLKGGDNMIMPGITFNVWCNNISCNEDIEPPATSQMDVTDVEEVDSSPAMICILFACKTCGASVSVYQEMHVPTIMSV